MNTVERQLFETLCRLETSVAGLATGEKVDLAGLFAEIDGLAERLPDSAPGELRHFLERKSYTKARHFLETRVADE